MSVIALVTGKLLKAPTTRPGKNGDPFTLATMKAATDDGDLLVNLIAFGPAGETLARLGAGDALSVTGRAKLNRWTAGDGQERHGLNVVADGVLTPYQVSARKRRVQGDRQEEDRT